MAAINFTTLSLFFMVFGSLTAQTSLHIPPTLSGPSIDLTLQTGTTDFYQGVTSNTMGANGDLLGPTLILQKDSALSISVHNQLGETTTIHWHGMHVSPQNDGGPHSLILPGETWNPQFTVMDKAGLNWYHPHLHEHTDEHVSKGIAGLIIVQDSEEEALNLPRTYGVDDFPLILQTKGFDIGGQIQIHTEMDTSVMVNGTINATVDLPAQIVRLRVLNGSSQRVYQLGFSDNRQFSLIGTDGGLLTAPVNLSRYRMAPGQRADILVDLSSSLGNNFQLMSFAAELPNAIYGAAQPGMGMGMNSIPNYDNNPLNGSNFSLLDINVVAQTNNPVLGIPSTLANYSPIPESAATITRSLTFTSAGAMGDLDGPFLINGTSFDMGVINYNIPLDNIEIWSLQNNTPIGHPFHIHDVQFFILDINGLSPPPELQGLNDVVFVPGGMGNVRFIAQFSDFANDTIPYMYHCHMLTHEDEGMMGQFLVTDPNTGIEQPELRQKILIYPNPSDDNSFSVNLSHSEKTPNSFRVYNLQGQLIHTGMIKSSTFDLKLPHSNPSGNYFLVFDTGETMILQLAK